jgi:hypothetical protein
MASLVPHPTTVFIKTQNFKLFSTILLREENLQIVLLETDIAVPDSNFRMPNV